LNSTTYDMTPRTLPIAVLRLDGDTQPRVHIDNDVVKEFADAREAGAEFPPITVFYDDANYWVVDGFHRVKSADSEISCEVVRGTIQEARWYSYSVNQTHGQRRTNEDKAQAVKAALVHPLGARKSDHQIAKHVGVAVQTVSNWRTKLAPSIQNGQMKSRTVTRKGTTYQQNTAKIGRRPAQQIEPAHKQFGLTSANVARLPPAPRVRVDAEVNKRWFEYFMRCIQKALFFQKTANLHAAELVAANRHDYDCQLWDLESLLQTILVKANTVRDARGQTAPSFKMFEWERSKHLIAENFDADRRLADALSRITGLCEGVRSLDPSVIRDQSSAEDLDGWAASAQALSTQLGEFAVQLKRLVTIKEETRKATDKRIAMHYHPEQAAG